MFLALPGNCWGGDWDSSRWGEMCRTDAADTLSSKLVIIHNIACVNIINIINIINWNINLGTTAGSRGGTAAGS